MDSIDKGILRALSDNCRITYRELALKFNISSSAIKKRVKKLEATGIITSYRLQVTAEMAGINRLYGMLTTDGSQDEAEFVNTLGANDKIIAAASYTGGNYVLIAEFRDSQDLWEIGAFLRTFDCVNNIETHQLLRPLGQKMEFSKLHLRILKTLNDDPRMSIVDIAEKSRLTARRIRKLVNEIIEGKAIRFTTFVELGAAGSIPFLMRIHGTNAQLTTVQFSHGLKRPLPQIFGKLISQLRRQSLSAFLRLRTSQKLTQSLA